MSEIIIEIFKTYIKDFLFILLCLWIISYFISKIEFLIFNLKK